MTERQWSSTFSPEYWLLIITSLVPGTGGLIPVLTLLLLVLIVLGMAAASGTADPTGIVISWLCRELQQGVPGPQQLGRAMLCTEGGAQLWAGVLCWPHNKPWGSGPAGLLATVPASLGEEEMHLQGEL